MANGCASEAFRQLARVFQEGTLSGLPDGEILGQFVERRDEAAFELLLRRHGPMVRNVCRLTLFDPHEVEDAFQATFLALVCKARSLRVEGSLGPWLYRVASRISARARANRRRRREHEVARDSLPEPSALDDPDRGEISRVVHEELGRLPERLRAPMVLCYLEGMTHELAASQLRCPVGTVRSRLARARSLLQRRITRRGLAIPAATIAALESSSRAAALPPQIARSLIAVAAQFTSGSASIRSGMGVSASVTVLMEGVLNVMRVKKLVSLAAALVAVGALAVVVGVSGFPAAGQTGDAGDDPGAGTVAKGVQPLERASEKPGPETLVKTYYVGDIIMPRPLGPGASAPNRRLVDMRPLISLITSTVARGSWRVFDGQGMTSAALGSDKGKAFNGRGNDITSQYVRPGRGRGDGPSRPVGSITPFFLSISLIVRQTPEVHEEVAELLRGLRRLLDSTENPGVVLEEEEERLGLPHQAHPTDPKPVTPQPIGGKALIPPSLKNPAAAGSSNAKPVTPQPGGEKAVVPLSQDKGELFKSHGNMLDDDRLKLIEYYQQQGYFEANVTPDVKAGKDLGELELTFVIRKGPRYHVRNVIIEGNRKIKTNVLKEDLKLHSGRPLLQAVRDADKNRMLIKYRKIGCIDTQIAVEPKFTSEPGVVDLVYKIVEGDPYLLGEPKIEGNAHTTER
jgi:RNA polymerase sigma factor (sigma-70 family)